MTDNRLQDLEEQLAHMARAVEDLSNVVATQDKDIALLTHRVRMLMEREAEREYDVGGSVPMADQKPPHY
ncbi:MAG: SlyX family protein [Pseudoruegeria sp.]